MPLYKIAKFAEMTGKKPKDIHAYISQKKIVKTKEGFIDTDAPLNSTFLEKHQDKAIKNEVEELEYIANDEPKKDNTYFLDLKKGEYLDLQNAKLRMDLEKKHGAVFPIELVKELVVKQAKALTNSYKQHLEQYLDQLAVKFKIGNADIMKALKEMSEGLNKAQLTAIATTKNEMKAIAREYGSKKGIGEHD